MTSFIELPRLGFDAHVRASLYVNTGDILALESCEDGQTRLEIRNLGNASGTASVITYVPLTSLLDILGTLARSPGVRSWSKESLATWALPIAEHLRGQAALERRMRKS